MTEHINLATVGMSVRNVLVMFGGPKPVLEIVALLQKYWEPEVERAEVEEAIAELEKRGLVARAQMPGWYVPTDKRLFQLRDRNYNTNEQAWEGWLAPQAVA